MILVDDLLIEIQYDKECEADGISMNISVVMSWQAVNYQSEQR